MTRKTYRMSKQGPINQDSELGQEIHNLKLQNNECFVDTEGTAQNWNGNNGSQVLFKTPFSPHKGFSRGLISEFSTSVEMSSRTYSRSQQETPVKKPKGKMVLTPEQKLILVAVRLAVLEKAASGLGVLAFVWATVVLLGGFVSTLSAYDFRLISILLLTEGTRIFSRSHELEWQSAASKSLSLTNRLKGAGSKAYRRSSDALRKTTEAVTSAFRYLIGKHPSSSHHGSLHSVGQEQPHETTSKCFQVEGVRHPLSAKAAWSSASLPLIPYTALFDAKTISRMLYLLQLASASVNIGFSITRLFTNNYGGGAADESTRSRNFAIKVFYSLALSEATIFLIERAYWEFEIRLQKLVIRVNKEGHFDSGNLEMMTQFFYDVYSKCLAGSVIEGLEMDLVHYAITKIQSGIGSEQLGGVRMLFICASNAVSGEHTLRTIGTTMGAVDRLVEMLTWKSKIEKQVRIAAAEIIRQLVKNQNNSQRVVSMPGALDAIVSLLIDKDEENEEMAKNADFSASKSLKLCGLKILKNLATIRSNHVQIGDTGGLIHILISSIEVKNRADLENTEDAIDIKIFKKSLQLLRQLALYSGSSKQRLGTEIGNSVYVLKNLRDILEHGSQHTLLQKYSIDIITSMALDGQMREKIGCSGGIIRILVALFFKTKSVEDLNSPDCSLLSLKAGEALQLLVVQNPKNCLRMIYQDNVCCRQGSSETLREFIRLSVTGLPRMATCAANILRSLCLYLDETARKEIAAGSMPYALRTAIETHEKKQQEAFLGLAAYTIPLLESSDFKKMFTEDFDKHTMIKKFMDFVPDLPSHPHLPRIRRHCIELANALMLQESFFLQTFRKEGLTKHLKAMLDTMSDLENYYTFSGAIGCTLHSQTMEQLIEKSLQLLHRDGNHSPC